MLVPRKAKGRADCSERPFEYKSRRRPTFPHSCPCSIIGPARLNFRVRDGNGCDPRGMTTGNSKLAYRFPCSSRAWERECDNRIWLALQVRLVVELHCAEKAFYCDSCESHLLFLKDGLRKFYD